jgi:cell wall-associated NlpC family hydrolase
MVDVRLFLILAVSASFAGCASTGAVPRPFPMPSGTPTPSSPGAAESSEPAAPPVPRRPGALTGIADGYSISSTALSLRGAPYRNGGLDPAGFDCSGFVKYVFEQHGVTMPRDTRNQFSLGKEIDPRQLEPGDLVFFTTIAPGASHVGIAVGGDQFVHAPSTNGVVRVENLSSQYWSTRFIGAKRLN